VSLLSKRGTSRKKSQHPETLCNNPRTVEKLAQGDPKSLEKRV